MNIIQFEVDIICDNSSMKMNIIHRETERRSSQRSMRALNRVNSSLGITPAWISTNQRIGDNHIQKAIIIVLHIMRPVSRNM